jgi:sugar lactone lactonase YvrE
VAVRAPGFRPDLEWINTGGVPLTLQHFRGRVLLLDFWTYGCINCIHMVPVLRAIERRFAAEVAVVGIHAGKFPNERVSSNIARACERLGVDHPVLNDRHFRTWREYAISAWPTLVVISPAGYVLGAHRGEVPLDRLERILHGAVEGSRDAGILEPTDGATPGSPGEDSCVRTTFVPDSGPLRFPAKVHAAADGRLFVADTGNHRVVEVDVDAERAAGRMVRVIGSGEPGWKDGPTEQARFRAPHGMALHGETLYVADTANHRVRSVDLRAGTVATVAGTGVQARGAPEGGMADEVRLGSPWDVAWAPGTLYVAMAGPHQIWRIELSTRSAEPWCGSGAEELHDASLPRAALAQPSGLAIDGERIFFADAEASAVRWATEAAGTGTVVGTGLFDFGDRDGSGDQVRLQHPLGLAWWRGRGSLLVADTYNHRIKRVDPATREARVLAGSGEAGLRDGGGEGARFWEPGGIAISCDERHAYVADTNNHQVRVVDLASGTVATLVLDG